MGSDRRTLLKSIAAATVALRIGVQGMVQFTHQADWLNSKLVDFLLLKNLGASEGPVVEFVELARVDPLVFSRTDPVKTRRGSPFLAH